MTEAIRYDRGADGVVVLTLDDPSRGANTMNQAFLSSLDTVLDRLEAERADVTGVIITSAKKTWFAGGDLDMLGSIGADQAEQAYAAGMRVKAQLRRLETLGRPVVAAINGSALGGGLELALACHHRIVADDRKIEIGFPEVTLGLLPGGGGVVRTVRLLGITEALLHVLLKGQRHKPAKALEIGLVHEVVPAEELEGKARAWIAANPDAVQPWDVKGYKIPGGTPSDPRFAVNLPAFPATLRKELKGAPYPAPRNILAAAVEGAQVDLATAFDIEGRYFTELATGQIAKNMIQAFFFDLQAANARGSQAAPFQKVAVLGAGMMGAGIAYVCARAGMQVLLKDVTIEAAQKGKAYSERLVQKGRGGPDLLDRITPTADPADLAGADLVIEAVFEDPGLKHKVFAEIEHLVSPGALLCSNTSTLPISMLADGVQRREDFVGLHFFSPVDKMPLVEIIRGQATTDETVERALGVVRQLRKTPIVVNDSRGFFTSRVIGTFTNEGIAMLAEGIAPASIEQASLQAGYPAPVLQLMDELTLTLPRKIRQETAAAVVAAGGTWTPHPADAVIDRMIDEFGRPGRSGGAGFYEYVDGKRTRLWPGLRFADENHTVPFVDMQERMLFAEAIESVKCLDEGVLTSVADANVGSILGIGFPGWTGGVLQYINQYEGGLNGFVARARELAARYGTRFEPPQLLLDKAARGEQFR
ncbi:3-hydroxyacyl-CoA dehydrogenase NAD-binding domain-containing protein [Dactylosporangium sp. AC04546]|uniref:3-hydroxyacyl-CoA dehydrogenase NAD-binding domain-containing protein n=1 Tax=Dactylosporangium sp. AC04546 TaxID=2862460 RepID=UPI001EDD8732|nr:3-hydroxyacyl-CoA dehydrogenase NAD-binding domain-containing protein [Dactylosporangium sp. AC04546]WVK79012.1 3-hydroxyacyl-CoA dehydrogenase NAD-binding domain-containing protein [Dactylosporangium sp. AC04546]